MGILLGTNSIFVSSCYIIIHPVCLFSMTKENHSVLSHNYYFYRPHFAVIIYWYDTYILGLARAYKIRTVWTHEFWTVRTRTVLGRSGTIGPSRPQDRPDFGPSGRSGRSKTVVLRACWRSKPPKNVGNCRIWPCVCSFWSQWSIKCEIFQEN